MPSESLLAAALEEDPSLLDYAFGKRVALASPVNLWAVLKTVAYTWTQQDVSTEARRLFELGNELYERLGALAGHADDLRRAIERTVDSYNRFTGSLESRSRQRATIPRHRRDQAGCRGAASADREDPRTADGARAHRAARADVGDLRSACERRDQAPGRG
jgi:DNA recombination protein RmuC